MGMAAPGFNSKSQKKTKTASSDSSEKPEKKPKTKKKEIEAQREDFEEVFHKTESEKTDDDGKKKVSDFVETFHETETKEKENKGNKQTDDKKSVKSGHEKKSDTFDEVFHTTPVLPASVQHKHCATLAERR